jgi:uncharacterized Zn finger protein
MYHHIHQDVECSQCKALNSHEYVLKGGGLTYIRCRRCGHEVVQGTTTTTSSTIFNREKPIEYNAYTFPIKKSF